MDGPLTRSRVQTIPDDKSAEPSENSKSDQWEYDIENIDIDWSQIWVIHLVLPSTVERFEGTGVLKFHLQTSSHNSAGTETPVLIQTQVLELNFPTSNHL